MLREDRNGIRKDNQLFSLTTSGSFKHAFDFLKRMQKDPFYDTVERCAQEGVLILSENTPKDTGVTASSWDYEIERNGDSYKIIWTNDNINKNVNIAVILQYGHGTRNGGYVTGIDYINPSTEQIFSDMVNNIWGEVTKV